MARTTQQVFNDILTEKEKYASLSGLTSNSNTAIWRSIFYVVAVIISVSEQLQDVFSAELTAKAEELPVGSRNWYAQKMLEYQEGYNLIYNRITGKLEYPVIDENAKIIKASACIDEADTVVIKVAKEENGALAPLTSEQQISVNSYINDFKFAGTVTRLFSYPPDIIKLSIDIKVDASKINTLGQSLSNTSVYPVEDAINEYLLINAKENFNGTLELIHLIDHLQEVDGVKNINITYAQAKAESGAAYLNILDTQFKSYIPVSGYVKVDPSHPLRDNITYVL